MEVTVANHDAFLVFLVRPHHLNCLLEQASVNNQQAGSLIEQVEEPDREQDGEGHRLVPGRVFEYWREGHDDLVLRPVVIHARFLAVVPDP